MKFALRLPNGMPLPDDTGAAIVNTVHEVGASEVNIASAAKQSIAA